MQTGVAEEDEVAIPPEGEQGEVPSEPQEPTEEVQGDEPSDEPEGEEEETVVSIGEEEPPTSEGNGSETTVFADLRKRYREASRREQQLAREVEELKARVGGGQQAPQKLREKPTLEGHEYDAEAFQADLDKWYAEKGEADRKAAEAEAAQRQAVEAQRKAVQAVQERYETSKKALKVKDFQEAEEEVIANLAPWQQGIAAKVKQPAELVYALGKNPKKLAEVASIKDPVEFAFAIADLRKEIKVTTRKATNKPAPETTVRGGSSGGGSKATLERLEAEAERTGDRTKLIAYKRQQRQAGK